MMPSELVAVRAPSATLTLPAAMAAWVSASGVRLKPKASVASCPVTALITLRAVSPERVTESKVLV